jgi:hypothetical protein
MRKMGIEKSLKGKRDVLLKARCGKILGDLRKKREKYII